MIHIGTAPDSWGIWYPTDKPEWKQYLQEVEEAGYRFSELGPFGYMPVDAKRLEAKLAAHNITICGGTLVGALAMPSQHERFFQDFLSMAELLRTLGVPYLIIMDESEAYSAKNCLENWQKMIAFVQKIKERGAKMNIQVLFHPHLGTCVETETDIIRFLEDTDYNLCFDTGHHMYTGADPLEFIKTYQDRIEYLHLKNIDAKVRQQALQEKLSLEEAIHRGVMCELEHGALDFGLLKELLHSIGYKGYAVVEQDMRQVSPGQSLRCARSNLHYIEELSL